ncbi:MAG: preprotein translocase subunit SecG [Bacteroidaceae bacterium]
MYLLLIILIVIAAILMCLIVMVQNSKGGGLAAGFASSNQIMGVRRTTDFLEKATWSLAVAIVILSVGASYTVPEAKVNDVILQEAQVEQGTNPENLDAGFDANQQTPVATPEATPEATPANEESK